MVLDSEKPSTCDFVCVSGHFLPITSRVSPRPFTHGRDLSPPIWGETSAGGQSVNGGTHEGGHRPYGGDLTLIDHIIN